MFPYYHGFSFESKLQNWPHYFLWTATYFWTLPIQVKWKDAAGKGRKGESITFCFLYFLLLHMRKQPEKSEQACWWKKKCRDASWNFSEIGQTESLLLLQGFVQGSTEKAQCKVGLQPTGMDSRVEPKQMGNSIKVNTRSIWASVIKLWALLIAVF